MIVWCGPTLNLFVYLWNLTWILTCRGGRLTAGLQDKKIVLQKITILKKNVREFVMFGFYNNKARFRDGQRFRTNYFKTNEIFLTNF